MLRKTGNALFFSFIALVSVLLIYFINLSYPVMGQQPKVDCDNPIHPAEMRFCAAKSYQEQDKKLNQVYKKVHSSLKGEEKRLLTTAQRNWIQFRDSNCNFEVFQFRGAGDYPLFLNGCLERLTQQRTSDLADYQKRG